ncbi:MAG: hypothetical protein K2O01_08080, partial [Bacteroidales bacterium]|nr:hypothetical protein [Bacteroidales bacterium]
MKTRSILKLLWTGIACVLFFNVVHAQETSTVTIPNDTTGIKIKRASKFQGLWQQRTGHSVYFDYGYQTGKLAYIRYYDNILTYKPIRFDLSYQYDISWNPKRINFYAHAGFGYRQLKTDYKPIYTYY